MNDFKWIYKNLKSTYINSLFRFLFHFTALSQLLRQETQPKPFDFFKVYLSSWWLVRYWFKACITDPYKEQEFNVYIDGLIHLKKCGLFDEENVNVVFSHEEPVRLARALVCLQEAGILTTANYRLTVEYENLYRLSSALSFLQKAEILDQNNFARVVAHECLHDLIAALSDLQEEGIFTPDNCARVIAHTNPSYLRDALYLLRCEKISTQDYFELIVDHTNPYSLVGGLLRLEGVKILTPVTQARIVEHASPLELAEIFVYLKKSRLWNDANVNTLLSPNQAALLTVEVYDEVWSRISHRLLTQAEFQEFLGAAEHANPMEELQRIRDQILNETDAPGELNNAQSTHTALIHRSTSESAMRLKRTYGVRLQEIKAYVNNSLFRFLFHFTALSQLLRQETQPKSFDFFKVYLSSWWLVRYWFRACITNPNETQEFNVYIREQFDEYIRELIHLKKCGLFNEENVNVVSSHKDPVWLARALVCLQEAGILTTANYRLTVEYENLYRLSSALSFLQKEGIFTPDNFARVVAHTNPSYLSDALYLLRCEKILTQDYFELIVDHTNPYSLVSGLLRLEDEKILTPVTQARIVEHESPIDLARIFVYLKDSGLWNDANVNTLLSPNQAALLTAEVYDEVWSRISHLLLTQAEFQEFLGAAEHANPMEELQRIRDQILNETDAPGELNNAQSTHTASIHRSTSESAIRLKATYGARLNVEDKIHEIKAYVNGLSPSLKHDAAKRYIAGIAECEWDVHTDSVSGVSTRELLGLVYVAIHDEERRKDASGILVPLDDAKDLFIEGLYEIQRGYNLDAEGVDSGGDDASICVAGAFNKLVEKLNGIHTDVEIYFITHAEASSKFPKLVQAYALSYLKRLASPRKTNDLLDKIDESGNLEAIWSEIKDSIENALWDEFSEAYGNNRQHTQFQELIDYGAQVNAPDLADVRASFVAPKEALQRQGLFGTETAAAVELEAVDDNMYPHRK